MLGENERLCPQNELLPHRGEGGQVIEVEVVVVKKGPTGYRNESTHSRE